MTTSTAPNAPAAEQAAELHAELDQLAVAEEADTPVGCADIDAWQTRATRRTERRAQIARALADLDEFGDLIMDPDQLKIVRSYLDGNSGTARLAARRVRRAPLNGTGPTPHLQHAPSAVRTWWAGLQRLTEQLDHDAPGVLPYLCREHARLLRARSLVALGMLDHHDVNLPWPDIDDELPAWVDGVPARD